MIYNLILTGRIESFARVKIAGEVKAGHNIRYKHLLYLVQDISGCDILVTI